MRQFKKSFSEGRAVYEVFNRMYSTGREKVAYHQKQRKQMEPHGQQCKLKCSLCTTY